MPTPDDFSILSLPEDEAIRTFFLTIVERHGLLNPRLQDYKTNLLAAIQAQSFSVSLFATCYDPLGTAKPTDFTVLYVALYDPNAWQAVLAADEIASLVGFVKNVRMERASVTLPAGFKVHLLHTLAKKIAYDLIMKSSQAAADGQFSTRINNMALDKATILLTTLIRSTDTLSTLPEGLQQMLSQHCLEFTGNPDNAVGEHAAQILRVLQTDPLVHDLALLSRFAVDYNLSYFYALFVELVDALPTASLSPERKINSLLACAAIFSFYQKLLHAEEIFAGLAQSYQADVFRMVIINSALACELDDLSSEKKPVFHTAFQHLFEFLTPVIEELCQQSPQVARLYGRAYLSLEMGSVHCSRPFLPANNFLA